MLHILGTVKRLFAPGRVSVAPRRRDQASQPSLESLERRRLLDATATITKLGFDLNAINNGGQIAANIATNGANHAYVYASGTRTDLGTLTGSQGLSIAQGINDAGQVVGSSYHTAAPHAFLDDGTQMDDLGTLSGDGVSTAYAVNNAGEVVGSSGNHAFLYKSSNMDDINLLANAGTGTELTVALGINDAGKVVGMGDFPDGQHAFLYDDATHAFQELNEIDNGISGSSDFKYLAINNKTQVVGEGLSTDGKAHAILWNNKTYTDLGTLSGYQNSDAFAIDNEGDVVGASYNGTSPYNPNTFFNSRAFMYSPAGGLIDLNSMLPTDSGWTLQAAVGINDHGQIIGYGTYKNASGNDVSSTFLLNLNSLPYTPAQIRTAYGISAIAPFSGQTPDGTGQTIAIVAAFNDKNIFSEMNIFDRAFGVKSSGQTLFTRYGDARNFLTVVDKDGTQIDPSSTTLPSPSPSGRGSDWITETPLDVEWAHAIAPGAKIVLVEVDPTQDPEKFTNPDVDPAAFKGISTAANYKNVSVVSLSFGLYLVDPPSIFDIFFGSDYTYWDAKIHDQNIDSLFTPTLPLNHPNVTFVVAAGEAFTPPHVPDLSYPAMSPDVVSVGGTTLTINADGTYGGDKSWKNTDYATSPLESEPAYQRAVQGSGNRAYPDVAFEAGDNDALNNFTNGVYEYYISQDNIGHWIVKGGNSLAAPCWAGLISIADQQRTAPGGVGTTLDGASQTLPALYDLPPTDFNPVNGVSGYTSVTGLGTPRADLLVPALAAWRALRIDTGTIQSATLGTPYFQAIRASGGGGHAKLTLTPTWTVYPAGLILATTDNEFDISGTPTAAGTYTFDITATDTNGVSIKQSYILTIYPTSASPTPPGPSPTSPQATGIASVSHSRQGLSIVTVAFDEALDASAIGNLSLYNVQAGVKKRSKITFGKRLRVKSVSYDPSTYAVSIRLAKPHKGVVQVTVRRGILATNGLASDSDFSVIVR